MTNILGRPLEEALKNLPQGAEQPRIILTAAPGKGNEIRQGGSLRIVCVRENAWIAARFLDAAPRKKEEA